MSELSLQERYAPSSICFGCGPANAHGLRLRSLPDVGETGQDETVCDWTPQPHHEAFPGMLSGRRIRRRICPRVQPSMIADSSMAFGMVS